MVKTWDLHHRLMRYTCELPPIAANVLLSTSAMNRPFWLNIFWVWGILLLPPGAVAAYLCSLSARQFGLSAGAQLLAYAALYITLLLVWFTALTLFARLSSTRRKQNKDHQSGILS
jgi:hypothetical protein